MGHYIDIAELRMTLGQSFQIQVQNQLSENPGL